MKLTSGVVIHEIPGLVLNDRQKAAVQSWINALRSGEYAHGSSVLQSSDGSFCVFGVACDVFHKDTGIGGWDIKEGEVFGFLYPREEPDPPILKVAYPPFPVMEHYGITVVYGVHASYIPGRKIGTDPRKMILSDLSDGFATFPELANILEIAMNGGIVFSDSPVIHEEASNETAEQ